MQSSPRQEAKGGRLEAAGDARFLARIPVARLFVFSPAFFPLVFEKLREDVPLPCARLDETMYAVLFTIRPRLINTVVLSLFI